MLPKVLAFVLCKFEALSQLLNRQAHDALDSTPSGSSLQIALIPDLTSIESQGGPVDLASADPDGGFRRERNSTRLYAPALLLIFDHTSCDRFVHFVHFNFHNGCRGPRLGDTDQPSSKIVLSDQILQHPQVFLLCSWNLGVEPLGLRANDHGRFGAHQ